MAGEYFIQPNGISIRPLGKNLKIFLNRFRGGFIYMIKKGTPIPEQLVLLHEFRDHHSLQTSVVCTEKEINERLTKFLKENAVLISKIKVEEMLREAKITL